MCNNNLTSNKYLLSTLFIDFCCKMEPRCRSRSPLKHQPQTAISRPSPTPSNTSAGSLGSSFSQRKALIDKGIHNLKLVNVPMYWKYNHVKEYIAKHTSSVNMAIVPDITYIALKKGTLYQESFIMFQTEKLRDQAFDLLKRTYEKVDGKKLFVSKIPKNLAKDGSKLHKPVFTGPKLKNVPTYQRNPQPNKMNIGQDNELYGLSIDFLKELNIVPPLTRSVFARYMPTSFDEAKVRNIFSQAGTILSLTYITKETYVNSRIEYDHPVEAVQAVSMFNGQEINGNKIKCEMNSHKQMWYDDLPGNGPGLGPNGTAMRGVRVSLELKNVRAEIMAECKRLDDCIEQLKVQMMNLTQAQSDARNAPVVQTVQNPIANVTNPLAALGTLLTSQLQPLQLLQSLMQQNPGSDMSSLGNALQNMTGSNITSMLQQTQTNQSVQDANTQGGSNMQGGPNTQGSSNMHGGSNMQGGTHMQGSPNMQVASNMHGGPNMQGGTNMQGSPNMHGGPNMQGGMNTHGAPNMQGGHSKNMPPGFVNPQTGHGNGMQTGPNYMQRGSNNSNGAPFNAQSGNNHMQGEPYNMQTGHQNMQHSNQNLHQLTDGQNNNPGFNMQPNHQGFSNMQTGYTNMQPAIGYGQNQQMNMEFRGSQFNSNAMVGQEQTGPSSMLVFNNLPLSVTLQALQDKMHEVGQVKMVEMTGPGRAIVSFFSDFDAVKCMKLFHQSKVDGQTIEVKKV